ncbi:hypothetical protein [Mesorhizobium onobrychidis]|uniref:Protein NO VEIN C-terminal domain-containing protein n=1 Tax=Mesorhizobium onobrychidis TaxID=2775404 RepID=A0ABY5R990_9HYPH|nr:hypothetical protein [Mesorhizobium onobrychidis]UVC19376.1 hypothetical protein IHQ72_35530 [Mesorhizobium onobrychidis]
MLNSVKIVITDEAIYFANTGRPMDRPGVISISNQYLSTKAEGAPIDNYNCRDGELASAISNQRLDLYSQNLNDLNAHVNEENAARRDYAGRALWELLQNADDAMAPAGSPSSELIGAKGLGFKSVLELTDRPEVHSGQFHFAFDPDRSATMLSKLVAKPPRLVFRLPHTTLPDKLVKSFRSEGFATVVKLPYKGAETREQVEHSLRGLAPHFLLLCQHLTSLEIQFGNGTARRMSKQGGSLNGMAVRAVLSTLEGNESQVEEWRMWSKLWETPTDGSKRLSATIAVKVEGKIAIPAQREIPVHVFFPTQETISAPFLVHAAFELRSDRNHLLAGAKHQSVLLDALGDLASHAASYLEPASALELFRPLAKLPPANVTRLDRKIERALGMAVHAAEFVPTHGGRLVSPSSARIWSHNLVSILDRRLKAIREARLCAKAVIEAAPALREFGAETLRIADYAELLANVRCKTLDECLNAADVIRDACLEGGNLTDSATALLAKGSFWFVNDGNVRPLEGKQPLVNFRSAAWPSWLVVDDLHSDFVKAVFPSGKETEKWAPLIEGRLLRSIDDKIVHCLVPTLSNWSPNDWAERGWEALETLCAWLPDLDWSKIEPFIPKKTQLSEPARAALIETARVPFGSDWVASADAYASGEIGGSHEMAEYFRIQDGRTVVGMPPKANVVGKGRWKALLRYLGVSWEPKIRAMSGRQDHGLLCQSRYWAAIEASSLRYLKCDWYVDGFPDAIADVRPARLLRMIEVLQPAVSQLSAAYTKVWGVMLAHRPYPFESCADYQLKREAYLPCRPSFTHPGNRGAPCDLYWPHRGLPGITPTLDVGSFPLGERSRLKKFLVSQLKVQEKLPDTWETWLDWADGLADHVASGGSISIRAARNFYEEFVSRKFDDRQPRTPKRVVAATSDKLIAVPAKDVVWIDEPKLASPEVHAELLATQPLFLPMLDRGAGSVQRLKTRKASELVAVTPDFRDGPIEITARLESRLKSRRRALAAVCERKGEKWAEPGILRSVQGLSLTLTLADQVISRHAAAAFHVQGTWLINLDAGLWEGLAMACADRFRNSADLRLWFVQILKAPNAQEVSAILRDGGIPSYRLEELSLVDDEAPPPEFVSRPTASLLIEPPGPSPLLPETDVGLGPREFDEDHGSEYTGVDKSDGSKADRGTRSDGRSTQLPSATSGRSGSVLSSALRKRPLYEGGSKLSGGGTPGRAIAAGAAIQARALGYAGEEWFARRLENTIAVGWTPSFNVRDEEVRESDVVLSSDCDEWHIEIKTLATERIYWSEHERRKAEDKPSRYLMAFLLPDVTSGFKVCWSWNPLNDLLPCERRVDWVWAASDPGPPLPADSWKPLGGLKRPERPPDRMNFAIRIQQAFLDTLPRENDDLELLWNRLTAPTVEEAAE